MDLINLRRGWPAPSLIPTTALRDAANKTLSDPSLATDALSYGPDQGYQPLIDAISSWLCRSYTRCRTTPEDICISGGASQNLARILQVYSDPLYTRAIWMASPAYYLACRIFEDAGFKGKLQSVRKDPPFDFLDVDKLRGRIQKFNIDKNYQEGRSSPDPNRRVKPDRPENKKYKHIIYLVPTYSNPTGTTMRSDDCKDLIRLARDMDALIITDDVYDFLPISWPHLGGEWEPPSDPPIPRMIDWDRRLPGYVFPYGNAVSNGSFSKLVGPGIRCGWADSNQKFAFGLSQGGSTKSGGAPSQFTAAMMADMITSGALEKHIKDVLVPAINRRAAKMMRAIKQYLDPLGVWVQCGDFNGGPGGYFVWLKLPDGVDADVLASRAQQGGDKETAVVFGTGTAFAVGDDKNGLNSFVRLCWAWEDEERIVEGVRRLGILVDRLKKEISES